MAVNATKTDSIFMRRALELASQGRGWVSPHPMAGAVVVQDDQIVGEGFLSGMNKEHAELCALDAAGDAAVGATMYLNLEPCAACVRHIRNAGIARVVLATEDANPMTTGRGLMALREEGIPTEIGDSADAARRLNESAFRYLATRRPFVAIRTAMSLDGKIATAVGESQYISGAESRAHLQELRATFDAVMVGINTVLQDDPDLDCTLPRSRNPLRVVIDSMARTPKTAKVLGKPGTGLLRSMTLVAVTKYAPEDRIRSLQAAGAEVLVVSEIGDRLDPHVDLNKLMQLLGRRGVTSVLVEGGSTLNAASLQAGVVDKLYLTLAPIILGGPAPTPVAGMGVTFVEEAPRLHHMSCRRLGPDLLIEAYLRDDS
jgi:diaminohydroxyphosphoribosylaminopyrimidine deaminase/5-amino-6-(5-phosphoribosylamino)uracil reductase